MKWALVAIAVLALAGAVYGAFYYKRSAPPVNTRPLVESYIRAHITELSPEPAVLGGTWYVTEVTIGTGTGTVSFEDGHIARVADFTYEIGTDGTVTIRSFVVHEV